jgi:hypothetical protein
VLLIRSGRWTCGFGLTFLLSFACGGGGEKEMAGDNELQNTQVVRSETTAVSYDEDNHGCLGGARRGLLGFVKIRPDGVQLIETRIATVSASVRPVDEGAIKVEALRKGKAVAVDFLPSSVTYIEEDVGIRKETAGESSFVIPLEVPIDKIKIDRPGFIPAIFDLDKFMRKSCKDFGDEPFCADARAH